MIVYRVCKHEEYNQIFSNENFNNIGNYFDNEETSTMNTHKYKENTRYLHFFLDLITSISYLAILEETYVCKYDIPDEILNQYKGVGYYIDMHNYHSHEAIEYAIESNQIKFDYLKQVIYIKEYVNPKKVYEGAKIIEFGEMVYDLTSEPFDNQPYNIDIPIEDVINLLPKSQNEDIQLEDIYSKMISDFKPNNEHSYVKKIIK